MRWFLFNETKIIQNISLFHSFIHAFIDSFTHSFIHSLDENGLVCGILYRQSQILIETLFTQFHIEGRSLDWWWSYLSHRKFSVKCDNGVGDIVFQLNAPMCRKFRVGLVLFNFYIKNLSAAQRGFVYIAIVR